MRQSENLPAGIASAEPGGLTLYRQESLEGLRSKLGRPTPIISLKSWALVLFMVAIMAGVIGFFAFSTFARKETVEGLIQPSSGTAKVSYFRAGVIGAVHVTEGQVVRKGQPLFSIALDPSIDGGGTLGSRVEAAAERESVELASQRAAADQVSGAQVQELRGRLAGLQAQRASAAEALSLRRERVRLSEETMTALTGLAGRGFISATRLRDKQAEVLAGREAVSDTERQIQQMAADIVGTEASLQRTRYDAAQSRARLRGADAELDQRRAQSASERGVVLTAPSDGRVVTIRVKEGSAVAPGALLAVILPSDGRLEVELWAPSRAAGFVRTGDEVRLMYDAFPFQRFGSGSGRVTSIATLPVDPQDLPLAGESKEALYRVRVALDRQAVSAYGREWPLPPGGHLRADLILERQSLMDWILDPLLASRARNAS